MRIVFFKAAVLILALWAGAGIFWAGCGDDDNPAGPATGGDYYVYFTNEVMANRIFRYNTGSGLVDNFVVPYNIYETSFEISPDGRTMYLYPDGFLVRIELDSLKVIAEDPIPAHHSSLTKPPQIYISSTGQYMALIHKYLYILDLADYSIIYSDTAAHYYGHFCRGSSIFLATGKDSSGSFITEINCNAPSSINKKYFTEYEPIRIVADRGNTLWAYSSIINGIYGRFNVYDRARDSMLFMQELCPGMGDLEITPDGRKILYSQPASPVRFCSPPNYFTVYGTGSNSIENHVYTLLSSYGMVYSTYLLCITPDGRHVIGASSMGSDMFDYNMVSGECTGIDMIDALQPFILKCQSNL